MKKIVFTLLVFLIVSSFVKAQEKENNETAKVYFLRSTGIVGSAAAFKTFIDGELVCRLNNKRYSIHEVPVGKHECYVEFGGLKINEKTDKCDILVEVGKITYVEFFLKNGLISFRIYCQEITSDIAEKKIKKMKLDTKCL
jgi:hypothetical protein